MSNAQLAINGGAKAVSALPARFHFGKEEKEAVDALFDQCIQSGNATGYNGPNEEAFGKEFAEYLGGGYADGVNSGTNTVYVALKSLDLPPFSEVIVGCVTDPGGMMPVAELNCIPVPADTAPGSFNTGAEEIEARITERTSAIVVAHIAGEPADMPAIMAVAEKHHLPVVEDCAQAHMALIHGRKAGSFGTLGAFSLMFGKHVCTGGQGGAIFTKSEEQYWKVRRAADRYPNLRGDISAGSGAHALAANPDYGAAFLMEFQDQLYFGTDRFTSIDEPVPPQIPLLKNWKDEGKISEEAYEKITHLNAEKLLNL